MDDHFESSGSTRMDVLGPWRVKFTTQISSTPPGDGFVIFLWKCKGSVLYRRGRSQYSTAVIRTSTNAESSVPTNGNVRNMPVRR